MIDPKDDRARIAIYALRRALLQMSTTRALAILRGVPRHRVTVAKEVVRLLGELPGGAAYADLLVMAGEDVHRDVRVALLRALWDHLERPVRNHCGFKSSWIAFQRECRRCGR